MVPRHATQRPRGRFDAGVNLYGSASVFSERTNHSPLLLRRLEGRLTFLEGARLALALYARRVRKDVRGP